jgi:hypothetical protein
MGGKELIGKIKSIIPLGEVLDSQMRIGECSNIRDNLSIWIRRLS